MARPALLWAGVVLAGLPLLLHFLRPKERARRSLPTLRFLTPDPRTRVRLRRRPDELLLLALRMGLCFLVGAALAGIAWVGPSEGTGVLVVVDGSPPMVGHWEEAREAAVAAGGEGEPRIVEVAVVRPGSDRAPDVLRFGPDEMPDAEAWAAIAPDDAGLPLDDVRLGHLVRALREGAARATGVDSLAARIVTVPRWSAWGPGTRELRNELWPGAIELVVPQADMAEPEAGGRQVTVTLDVPEGMRERIEAALAVLGLVEDEAPEGGAALRAHLQVGPESGLGDPWRPGEREAGAASWDAFLLLDGRTVSGAGVPPSGHPDPDAGVPLLRAGGRPGAAARPGLEECRLALPLDPEAPILETGDLAVVLEALIGVGCGLPGGLVPVASQSGVGAPAGAFEVWRAFLAGEGMPARAPDEVPPVMLEARPLRGPEAGRSLTRLLLALALGVGVLEILRVRAIEASRRGEGGVGADGSSAPHRGTGSSATKETITRDEKE